MNDAFGSCDIELSGNCFIGLLNLLSIALRHGSMKLLFRRFEIRLNGFILQPALFVR